MLTVLWVLLIIMLLFYVGGLSWGLVEIGAGEDVPAYVIAISSMLIFVFGILKAGSIIFRKQGYDMAVSLPVRKGAVVLGRRGRICHSICVRFLEYGQCRYCQ